MQRKSMHAPHARCATIPPTHWSIHLPECDKCRTREHCDGQAPVVALEYFIHFLAEPGGVPEFERKPLADGQHLGTREQEAAQR